MLKKRLIPVLILRNGQVVQSLRFTHTNVIHARASIAVDFFNKWSADEIVVLDVTRENSNRQVFYDVVQTLSKQCFVPLTVGGWIDSAAEVRTLLERGADKVTINTQAYLRPELITECANIFGSQCIVVSIDARRDAGGRHEVCIDRGRKRTGTPAEAWALQAQERGAGEIFLTSIDKDGSREGYDIELFNKVIDAVAIPVIGFGGVSTWQHLVDGIVAGRVDAVSAANVFHYTEHSTRHAKEFMRKAGLDVR